jgi:hypothetical protein
VKKPWIWLRVAAVLLFLFVLLHSLGSFLGRNQYRDANEQTVMTALKEYRFDAIGVQRSHFDFYTGFSWFTSASVLVIAILIWQLAAMSRRDPRGARPMIVTLCAGAIAFTILCWIYFFILPLAFFAAAALSLALAARAS